MAMTAPARISNPLETRLVGREVEETTQGLPATQVILLSWTVRPGLGPIPCVGMLPIEQPKALQPGRLARLVDGLGCQVALVFDNDRCVLTIGDLQLLGTIMYAVEKV